MINYLKRNLEGLKILVLGYGREGKSTAKLLSSVLEHAQISIADQNEAVFENDLVSGNSRYRILTGNDYPADLTAFDLVIKTPGIRLDDGRFTFDAARITSQTDLFLAVYGKQTVGITGTKGKSTTSSLLYHIVQSYTGKALFGGNIGIPLFDLADHVTAESIVICELSSHQLQYTRHAPHIGVLLNLYQEHLDHYPTYLDYQKAKFNIALNQVEGDYFVYTASDENINSLIESHQLKSHKVPVDNTGVHFSSKLTGEHNMHNAQVAATVASLLGIPEKAIEDGIAGFIPLEHRLEFAGEYKGVRYYNDSISTIPEAAIAAIESLKPVDTLILGGFDRGIDYSILAAYLEKGNVRNVITTGPAGMRIFELVNENEQIEELYFFTKFDEAVEKAIEITPKGGICLLSPAASSYNEFRNFEERGKRFKEMIRDSRFEI